MFKRIAPSLLTGITLLSFLALNRPTFCMDKSNENTFCYESLEQLNNDLKKRGHKPEELIARLKNDLPFPPVTGQTTLKWYPFNYFREHGGFDGKSTLDVTLLNAGEASDQQAALDYCNNSVFMSSYREMVQKTFSLLEQAPQDAKICLPAGGIPYYAPRTRNLTVYDTDASLQDTLKKWPHCNAVLGENGDVQKIKGMYDIICCMGFSFYLKNMDELKKLIRVMHEHLNENGTLMLNFIHSDSGINKDGQKMPNFDKALDWNMAVVFGLNKNPKFTGLFLTTKQLTEACGDMFDSVDTYDGSFHVHGLALLKKRRELLNSSAQ